jgi:ribosome-associated protein
LTVWAIGYIFELIKGNKIKRILSNKSKTAARKAPSHELLNEVIVEAIQNLKGKNIIKLDLRHIAEAPSDYFIVCEGDSTTQVSSIAENINREVWDQLNTRPNHIEGARQAQWVLVDYFNTVVHVFHPEARKFYELEDMWSDAKFTQYQSL